MRIGISILILLSSIYICTAQNISVESFRAIENDLDARVYYPKRDQNNEVCAIIKVVTTQTGFKFDVGSLGITATEQKTGEIWVYVPRGVQRITISHSQLGVLRNYPLNIPIEAAKVYELVLTTAKVTTIVEQQKIESQWLVITSEPKGADVFIDNMPVGKTPFQKMYKEGKYDYRVELPKYHPQAGIVSLKGEKQQISLTLKPKFGSIYVKSMPENGMEIYLNEENTGKKTPATIEGVASGVNKVQLRSSWYEHQAKNVTVREGETTTVDFQMQPAFANITINANPSADILVNNERKGNTKWEGRLTMGVYKIKVEKDKYYTQTQDIEITPGNNQQIDIELKPKKGSINISVDPIGANIIINGEHMGEAPLTIRDLLVGDHNLTINKAGYATINKKITITENQELDIYETLSSGSDVVVKETKPPTITTQQEESADSFTDARDGNTYKIVKIGNQVWMAENLKYLPSVVGPSTGSNTTPYYYVYGYNGTSVTSAKSTSNYKTYGVLYNWPAAMNGARSSTANPSGVQGICPTGWHLPSDAELKQLEMYLGMSQKEANEKAWRGTNEGGKLKEAGTSHWKSPNEGVTNESGFTALPGGYRYDHGYFGSIGHLGIWWSATEFNDTLAWYRYMYYDYSEVRRYYGNKELGFSVRCLRD